MRAHCLIRFDVNLFGCMIAFTNNTDEETALHVAEDSVPDFWWELEKWGRSAVTLSARLSWSVVHHVKISRDLHGHDLSSRQRGLQHAIGKKARFLLLGFDDVARDFLGVFV